MVAPRPHGPNDRPRLGIRGAPERLGGSHRRARSCGAGYLVHIVRDPNGLRKYQEPQRGSRDVQRGHVFRHGCPHGPRAGRNEGSGFPQHDIHDVLHVRHPRHRLGLLGESPEFAFRLQNLRQHPLDRRTGKSLAQGTRHQNARNHPASSRHRLHRLVGELVSDGRNSGGKTDQRSSPTLAGSRRPRQPALAWSRLIQGGGLIFYAHDSGSFYLVVDGSTGAFSPRRPLPLHLPPHPHPAARRSPRPRGWQNHPLDIG